MTLVEAARALLGTPWQHQARSAAGVDCLGLLVLAERATGREVADRTNYGRTPDWDELRAGLAGHYGPPVARAPQPGDKLLMTLRGDQAHVGIVGEDEHGLTLIHSYAGGLCRVVEHRLDAKWRRRIVEVYA